MAKYYKYKAVGKIQRKPKEGYFIDKYGNVRAFTLKQFRRKYKKPYIIRSHKGVLHAYKRK